MSEKIVNALAEMKRVYIEEVSHNNLIQKRLDEEAVQIEEYKKAKRWWDDDGDGKGWEEGEVEGSFKRKPKSEEDDYEYDEEDEDEDEKPKSKKKKKSMKESRYYSWRDTIDEQTLLELIDSEEQKQIKEKRVNNYIGKDPVVSINPEIKTESVILDTEELDEDFIEESIDIVSDYLCEEGLTLEEIENLIEEVGVEEFYEWILEFGYNTLLEWRRGPGGTRVRGAQVSKTGKAISSLKGGAKASAIRATPEHKQRKAEKEAPSTPSGMTAALRSQAKTASKKETPSPTPKEPVATTLPPVTRRTRIQGKVVSGPRPTRKPTSSAKPAPSTPREPTNAEIAQNVKRGILDIIGRAGLSTVKGFETAIKNRKQGKSLAQQLGGGAGAALGSFIAKGTSQFREWVDDLLQEGYDLSSYTWDELYEEYEELYEKAVSEQQQKLFGLALSVKRGETSREKVSKEVLKIVDTMSEKEIRKYAGTPHKGIPEKKEEKELAEKVIQFVRENY